MINLIYQMQSSNIDTTVTNIVGLSKLSRDAVYESVSRLIERDLLREEHILNIAGKGRAYRLVIPEEIFGPKMYISLDPGGLAD